MKTWKIPLFLLFSVLSVYPLFAQDRDNNGSPSNPQPPWVKVVEEKREQDARLREKIEKDMRIEKPLRSIRRSPRNLPADVERIETLEEELKKFVVPSKYIAQYSVFLNGKNNGIARLFPDIGCEKGKIVDVKQLERCADRPAIPGYGSRYSVRLNKIPAKNLSPMMMYGAIVSRLYRSNLHYVGDKLVVGTPSILDLISEIGEVDIEKINLKSDSVEFLREFKHAKSKKDLELQKQEIKQGIKANGYFYTDAVAPKLGTTYVMRSIAYAETRFREPYWDTDLITVLKVVGVEVDGSIVFIWKNLRTDDAPFLKI